MNSHTKQYIYFYLASGLSFAIQCQNSKKDLVLKSVKNASRFVPNEVLRPSNCVSKRRNQKLQSQTIQ